jgi:hypothetical protein
LVHNHEYATISLISSQMNAKRRTYRAVVSTCSKQVYPRNRIIIRSVKVGVSLRHLKVVLLQTVSATTSVMIKTVSMVNMNVSNVIILGYD